MSAGAGGAGSQLCLPMPGTAAAAAPSGDGGRPSVTPEERLARVAIGRLAEPGDAVIGHWLAMLGPVELLRVLVDGDPLPRMRAERIRRIRRLLPEIDPLAALERCRSLGGRFICPGDTEWPSQLDDLGETAPYGLWVRGRPSLRLWALRSVAVVGARACTDYGRHVAGELGAELAESGWVVVSGAAYGIDAAAHRGALAVGGATVAVLACGVDTAYPPRHESLLQRIAEQGLVIAELAPGSTPNRGRFVTRNRVIAALTRGTVVVEAGRRSGSLITARRARELNRQVMGVPGPVTSALSEGSHALLRDGAVLVGSGAEVVEQVGGIGTDLAPERAPVPALPRELLPARVAAVLEAVPGGPGGTAEEMARHSGADPRELLRHLYELAALGFVERAGPCWRLPGRRGRAGPPPSGRTESAQPSKRLPMRLDPPAPLGPPARPPDPRRT